MSKPSSSRTAVGPLPSPRAGHARWRLGGTLFELPFPAYALHKLVGIGAYGSVASGTLTTAAGGTRRIAVKRVGDAFRDKIDGLRVVREVSGQGLNMQSMRGRAKATDSFAGLVIIAAAAAREGVAAPMKVLLAAGSTNALTMAEGARTS